MFNFISVKLDCTSEKIVTYIFSKEILYDLYFYRPFKQNGQEIFQGKSIYTVILSNAKISSNILK